MQTKFPKPNVEIIKLHHNFSITETLNQLGKAKLSEISPIFAIINPKITATRGNWGVTKLECRKRGTIELKPHILALAMSSNDGFVEECGFKMGTGDSVDDLGIVCYDWPQYLLSYAMFGYGGPRRLYLRELRHDGGDRKWRVALFRGERIFRALFFLGLVLVYGDGGIGSGDLPFICQLPNTYLKNKLGTGQLPGYYTNNDLHLFYFIYTMTT